MKHLKKFENGKELDVSERLSEMFFENTGNFGSEEEQIYSNGVLLTFYFLGIEDDEFEKIRNCKDFIEKYTSFYLSHSHDDITANFKLKKDEYYKLKNKLDIHRDKTKYNL